MVFDGDESGITDELDAIMASSDETEANNSTRDNREKILKIVEKLKSEVDSDSQSVTREIQQFLKEMLTDEIIKAASKRDINGMKKLFDHQIALLRNQQKNAGQARIAMLIRVIEGLFSSEDKVKLTKLQEYLVKLSKNPKYNVEKLAAAD